MLPKCRKAKPLTLRIEWSASLVPTTPGGFAPRPRRDGGGLDRAGRLRPEGDGHQGAPQRARMPRPRDVFRIQPLKRRRHAGGRHGGDEPAQVGQIRRDGLRGRRRAAPVRAGRADAADARQGRAARAPDGRSRAFRQAPSGRAERAVLPHRRLQVPLQQHALCAGGGRQRLLRQDEGAEDLVRRRRPLGPAAGSRRAHRRRDGRQGRHHPGRAAARGPLRRGRAAPRRDPGRRRPSGPRRERRLWRHPDLRAASGPASAARTDAGGGARTPDPVAAGRPRRDPGEQRPA